VAIRDSRDLRRDPRQAGGAISDYSPAFQFGHPRASSSPTAYRRLGPATSPTFLCNSVSEAGRDTRSISRFARQDGAPGGGASRRDSAASAGLSRGRLRRQLGRASSNDRKLFGTRLSGFDHLRNLQPQHQAFTNGEPEWARSSPGRPRGIVRCIDASTIRGGIVDHAGSTGRAAGAKLSPAPSPDLRQYGILLISTGDTGFRRLGFPSRPSATASCPTHDVCQSITSAPFRWACRSRASRSRGLHARPEHVVELFHGYTYSAHPLALARPASRRSILSPRSVSSGLHDRSRPSLRRDSLKAYPTCVDIRTVVLTAGIDLLRCPTASQARPMPNGRLSTRGTLCPGLRCEPIAVTPPLIVSEN